MISNKTVAAFTNEEELLLIPDAKEVFPFLLQNKLVEQGATFDEGYLYLNNIAHDGNLITGQNPWSVWSVAESMIKQLGYTPVKRPITPEENTINVLIDYEEHGIEQAKNSITFLRSIDEYALDRTIIAIHMFVYALRWEIGKSIDMIRLLSFAKIWIKVMLKYRVPWQHKNACRALFTRLSTNEKTLIFYLVEPVTDSV